MEFPTALFLDCSVRRLRQSASRIEDCLGRLSDDQIWARGARTENAVGNLVLHLGGNVRQWIVSGVGGLPDIRERDAEFAAEGGISGAELAARLRAIVDEAAVVIEGLPDARLTERLRIQQYDVTALEAIYHVVEHFSGHTGQIIYATKMLTGEDLAYYRHLQAAAPHNQRTP